MKPIHYTIACAVLGATFVSSAEDKPVLPFQIAGSNHVIVGVAWDPAAVQKMLPAGMKLAEGATGAINIYQASKGYGITPYQSVYFWVDVEGYDSPDGTKGRWMLAGAYGPQEKTSAALRENGFPVRNGTSRFEATDQGKRAIGTVNGKDVVTVEIKSSSEPCDVASGLLKYPTMAANKLVVTEIPYVGDVCKAEPVSVTVTAPENDPFAAFKPVKTLWAVEFKNAAFSINRPVAAK